MAEALQTTPARVPRENRVDISRCIEVTRASEPSDFLEATVLNLCRTGLQLAVDRRFERAERLTVYWGQRRLSGSVVYCRQAAGGFRVGVKLEPDLHWQRQLFAN